MSVFVEQFLQTLVAGLLIGCIYGLMCVGLAFIFGIMRVVYPPEAAFVQPVWSKQ